jgi:Domain of unknown function (DUF4190)
VATLEPLPPPPPRPPAAAPAARTSGKAIAAMVLGIVGLVLGFLFVPLICCVLAIVFGSIALQEVGAPNSRLGGRGQALAGLVLGIIGLVGWGLTILVAALTSAV